MSLKANIMYSRAKRAAIPALILVLGITGAAQLSHKMVSAQESAPYSPELEQKITTRCVNIKEYLKEQVRIPELASRQNKVRGWEFLLRNLDALQTKYEALGVDQTSLNNDLSHLSSQLEQFKLDFEAYDSQLQQLVNIDCESQPELFWQRLQTARSFRSGISQSSKNYSKNIQQTIRAQQELISPKNSTQNS